MIASCTSLSQLICCWLLLLVCCAALRLLVPDRSCGHGHSVALCSLSLPFFEARVTAVQRLAIGAAEIDSPCQQTESKPEDQ